MPAEQTPSPQPTNRRAAAARGALWGARILSVLLAVGLFAATGYGFAQVRRLNNGLHRLSVGVGQPPTEANGVPGSTRSGAPSDVDGTAQNILVVGNDDRSNMTDQEVGALHVGRDGGSENTDTMLIVHVPADGSSATLISLPRDSYVSIPGHGMNRLNSAYATAYYGASGSADQKRAAGADLLIKTVTQLTGLTIDHFVQVSLLGFYRIAQAIGGVPVNLCGPIDGRPYTNLVLSGGKHRLDPVQALEFVRDRHSLPLGDIDRVVRQRYFLTAAFRSVTSAGILLSPNRLGSLIAAIHDSVWADRDFDLLKFASQMSSLTADHIAGMTIPYVRFQNMPGLGDVNVVDAAAVRRAVTAFVDGTDTALAGAKPVDPSTVDVSVVAARGVGATGRAVGVLGRAGFHVTTGAALPTRVARTTVEYARGMESQAKTVARYVKGAVVEATDGAGVTLVLGSDGRSPQRTPVRHKHHKPIDASCIN